MTAENRDVSGIVAHVRQLVTLMRQLRRCDRPSPEYEILTRRIRQLLQEIDSVLADNVTLRPEVQAAERARPPTLVQRLNTSSELTVVETDDFQGVEDFSVIEDLRAFSQRDVEHVEAPPEVSRTSSRLGSKSENDPFNVNVLDDLMSAPIPVSATVYHDPTAIRQERNRTIISSGVVVMIGAAVAANLALLAGMNGLQIAIAGILGSGGAILVWKALGGMYQDL